LNALLDLDAKLRQLRQVERERAVDYRDRRR
jgi:hypothetical protein